MDRERLDGWCERGILGLVLAILVFGPLATGAVRLQDFVVIQWLTVAVIGLWVLRCWISPQLRFLCPPVGYAVLAFVAYAIGRYATADIEYTARQELIRVLVYAVLFFAILNNLQRVETLRTIGVVLVILAMGIAFSAIYQFITGSDRVLNVANVFGWLADVLTGKHPTGEWHFLRPATYAKRGSGTYICPNHAAGFLEMVLPLGLALIVLDRCKPVARILLGYASLAIFLGIAATVSRGGWVAAGVALVVFFALLIRRRGYFWQSAVLALALAGMFGLFCFKAQFSTNRNHELSKVGQAEDIRILLWQPAVAIWQEHFWWGGGPGHYDYLFRAHRPGSELLMQSRPDRVHNDYLNTLADWGLTGSLLVLTAWALFYGGVFRGWAEVHRGANPPGAPRGYNPAFTFGAGLGLLAILVHSFFDYNMHIPANAILVVTLMALLTSQAHFVAGKFRLPGAAWLKLMATALLLTTAVYLTQQAWRRSVETYWLAQAARQPEYSDAYAACLRRAFAAEDRNFETAYSLGETFRLRSWQGYDDYAELAREATSWFARGIKLNPIDPYCYLRYGMCLHWLGRHDQAEPYFKRATEIDPNGYYTVAHVGWHYFQIGDYAKAKMFFERSLGLYWINNPIARSYLKLTDEKLAKKEPLKPKP